MKLFETIGEMGHQQVLFRHDPEAGLKAIIAIHSQELGPAMGATRLFPYTNEADALRDVLRLSRGMTYKAACANLPVGGGKGVIIADPTHKNDSMLKAYGRFVESLKGQFITGQDVNLSPPDLRHIRCETDYVVGVEEKAGGPAPITAAGVLLGIKAAVEFKLQRQSLEGLKVAVQGLGNVGKTVAKLLAEHGAQLFVSDLKAANTEEVADLYGAAIAPPNEIHALPVDVFSPCAMGGILNSQTIPQIQAGIIAGAANNQLEHEQQHGSMLSAQNILYCPDYVINAGGLINVYHDMVGYSDAKVLEGLNSIYSTLLEIFAKASQLEITTHEAAKQLAEERIQRKKEGKREKGKGRALNES
ncbi:MAG: leucine dehydrogenase [Oculatellaceae cyanobacterium Prado106]|nr:leucine dehydrogenase [Oculatellaceae cyanobacterium Prado106]